MQVIAPVKAEAAAGTAERKVNVAAPTTSISIQGELGGPVPRDDFIIGLIMTRQMYEEHGYDDIGKAIKQAVDGKNLRATV